MQNEKQKDCHGSMFPDSLHLKDNVPNAGKVFTVWVKKPEGGVLPVHSDRSIEINNDQWEECQRCVKFESCYKFSMAKLALESAVASQ
tara:strand:- start:93 stop:356 length:264 start_codon:yes stop_codon:yes gene_type:complete